MRNSRFLRQALVVSAMGWVWVTGCTSNSTPSGGALGGSRSLAQDLAEAHCRRLAACCGGATTPAADAGATDGGAAIPCSAAASADGGASAACVARAELAATQQLALVQTAYGEGLVSISAAVEPPCVAAYEARACTGAAGDLDVEEAVSAPACAGLFTGYIPAGYRCDTSLECLAGLYCLAQGTQQTITSLSGAGTLGICFPYQQAGEPCNATADCLPPLTCDPASSLCQ